MSSPPASPPAFTSTVIRPRSGWQPVDFSELWRFRDLLLTLAARDIRVRYKQTVLGALWAVMQPLAQMVVFTAFFASHGFSTEGTPAPVFYFAGLLPWQLFASSVTNSATSLVANRGLVTKVYFPRLIIPLSAMSSALVDFAISCVVLTIVMAANHVWPSPHVVYLPAFVALSTLTALSFGLFLSAVNVEYRDIQYVTPFLIQFWMFVTPVIYPLNSVTGLKRTLLSLNPLSGIVEGIRWCLLGRPSPGPELLMSVISTVILLAAGLAYFRRVERHFADQL